MNKFYKNFDFNLSDKQILLALKEDVGNGDITSELLINGNSISSAEVLLKEDGVVAGIEIFKRVFLLLDKSVKFKNFVGDGVFLKKNKVIGTLSGKTKTLLTAERTALNILQRISGVATKVYFLKKKLNNDEIEILDTRKTTPNFRIFEKLGVKIGGGKNHRFGLFDMILIKDNHIEANKGIINILNKLKEIKIGNLKVEIEVKNLKEIECVLEFGKKIVDIIMLDNFSISKVTKAVKLIKGEYKIEVSGGVNEKNIGNYSKIKGVDYISIGALTHSVKSLDISLNISL